MADVSLSAEHPLEGKKKNVKPVVLTSIETPEGDRCVDIFERDNGTFGFEEWRRDVESVSGRFATGNHAGRVFDTSDAAMADARDCVGWLADKE